MTRTPNYNLKKPAQMDFYNVDDHNFNSDTIDTALKAHADSLAKKADLDTSGKVKTAQLPAMDYVPTAQKAAANGVATLGSDGKVPSAQLPAMDYIPNSKRGAANGVASLGSDGKVPATQLPSMSSVQNLSYRGTGSYGSAGSANTRINFGSFLPRFITITDQYGEYFAQFIISNSSGVKMYGFVTHMSGAGSSEESYEAHVVPCSAYMQRINDAYQFWFYSNLSAELQMNDSDITYHVVAVG